MEARARAIRGLASATNATGDERHVLLAGDETAVMAISSSLETLAEDFTGTAYLEVPDAGDVLPLATRSRVRIMWLNRDGGSVSQGHRLGEAVGHAVTNTSIGPGTYAWVGAETGTVRNLRRSLCWCRD